MTYLLLLLPSISALSMSYCVAVGLATSLPWQWYIALFLMTLMIFTADRVLDVYFFKLTSSRHTQLFAHKKWFWVLGILCIFSSATILIPVMNTRFIGCSLIVTLLLIGHFWAMKYAIFSGFKEISSSLIFTLGACLGPITYTSQIKPHIIIFVFSTVLTNVLMQAYFDAPADTVSNQSALINAIPQEQIKKILYILIFITVASLCLVKIPLPLLLSLNVVLLIHLGVLSLLPTNLWSDKSRLCLEMLFWLPGVVYFFT